MTAVKRAVHFSIEGVRVHGVDLGPATSRTPLLLLHGLYDSHRTWKNVAPAFARDRRVLMPDLPGHGLSDRPDASYELGWHAGIIARWLEALGVKELDVVGHSFGGGVAQMLLLERRLRIRRLVLVASGGLGREVGSALRLASVRGVVERFGQPFMRMGTYVVLLGAGAFSRSDIRELAEMNAEPGSARAFARTVRDVIDWRGQRRTFFDRAHTIQELPAIAVLWGSRDKVIPIAHAGTFADALENVVFVPFEGCGHYLHREEPEAFARVVRELLEEPSLCPARLREWGQTAQH
ncbi:putative hydrolase [Labilithrix luteola]|uniref:Putative hydrolase n=1 Tax=Labilithrix luteola TaxID=1391654 RepID=A0A0K1PTW8_9BACT|nr:alpha/beta fold hydrolase [Labilithrix luteola]AKU96988.1 putative hydrolase [Labilithrix luteola]